jgi:SAM-dependent methyltransferase
VSGDATHNGFALRSDLEDPRLAALRDLCLREAAAFGGRAHLDWSRQWEYPWVLANLPADGAGRRLLDAGSGYRFFAPLLAHRGFRVECCDLDASIGPRLAGVAAREGLALGFRRQDLARLTYADACFDHVCCVSVLEHAPDPRAVVGELRRCLAPGGTLLVTFDVSLDGERDVPLPVARELVAALEAGLEPLHAFRGRELLEGDALRSAEHVLRTSWFRRHRPGLLPWRFLSRAYLSQLRRGRLGRPFFELAVIGMALRKPA